MTPSPSDEPPPVADADQQATVTRLLREWQAGEEGAFHALLPMVYGELRRLARSALRRERAGHTLQTTALVHEAYLRLAGSDSGPDTRRRFMGVAANVMRRVLVDHARRRKSKKRGGDMAPLRLDTLEPLLAAPSGERDLIDIIVLDEALEELMEQDERPGRAVELHYFGGLSYAEVAEALDVSEATVDRDLRFARAWLYRKLDAREETQ